MLAESDGVAVRLTMTGMRLDRADYQSPKAPDSSRREEAEVFRGQPALRKKRLLKAFRRGCTPKPAVQGLEIEALIGPRAGP